MSARRKDVSIDHAPAMERDRSQKGVAIIEFAIILPIFLLLLFGMVTFSIALYDKTVLTMATREGARTGALYAPGQEDEDKIDLANATVSEVCANNLISFGAAMTPNPQSSIQGDVLTVTASSTFTALYIFPDIVLSAETSMRIE